MKNSVMSNLRRYQILVICVLVAVGFALAIEPQKAAALIRKHNTAFADNKATGQLYNVVNAGSVTGKDWRAAVEAQNKPVKSAGRGGSAPAPNNPGAVLYDQTSNPAGNGAPDQDFEASFDSYDSEGADDFVVPAGRIWTVQTVVQTSTTGTPANQTADVVIYSNAGGNVPGGAVCTKNGEAAVMTVSSTTTNLSGGGCVLPAGTYWVGINVNQNFASFGQHFWSNRTVQSNAESVWRNPGDGFASGCTNFSRQTTCGVGGGASPDFLFRLEGLDNPDVPPVTLGGVSLADPLSCTGPGNKVNGNFSATNGGLNPVAVSLTATLTNLATLPGMATATQPGTITLTATTVNWTGTLNPGQTVTVNWMGQLADGLAAGTQACSTVTAIAGGQPVAGQVQACAVINCPAVGPGGIFPPSSEASDQKAGSLLVYNVYTSSTDPTKQNTRINITNVHQTRPAFVHLFFVAEGCAIADSYICLTANQTASFLASDLDPGTTGYLVAVAVDGIRGCPTSFNYLIGDEFVKFNSGHAANLGAVAFSQIAGGLPACDGNSVTATLNFDGISYNRTPATLALSNIGSRADGNDTMLILNRIGGNLGIGASTLGTLFGILYDDAENALSFNVAGACQLRNSLSNNFPRTTPRFETFIPAGRTGWLKVFNQTGAIGMTGAAINFNANAASSAGAFNQGHNLHHLTLNSGMSYVIPVFPPSC